MDNAREAIERLISESLEREKQLADVLQQNEKLNVENQVLRTRLKELEPYEALATTVPESITVELDHESAVKLYSVSIDIYGSKANPSKAVSERTKQRATKLIDFVANNMIKYICRNKARIHAFLKESKLHLEEEGNNES